MLDVVVDQQATGGFSAGDVILCCSGGVAEGAFLDVGCEVVFGVEVGC